MSYLKKLLHEKKILNKINIFVMVTMISFVVAEVPKFHPEVLLVNEDGGEYWNYNSKFLTPTYSDWDEDGDNDLLIGYMHGSGPASSVITGKVMLYDNIGTNDEPKFKNMGDIITVHGA